MPTYDDARPGARGKTSDPRMQSYNRRMRLFIFVVVIVCSVFIAWVVCTWSPLFKITSISVSGADEHVSDAQVTELAAVPAGATLFNYDESGVTDRLLANPWIQSVTLTRSLPNTLAVNVVERQVGAIVMLSNSTTAWRLSTDGVWIEQVQLTEVTADNGADGYDVQAKAAASSEGVVYVSDVSATLEPEPGAKCEDEALLGVIEYMNSFSSQLRDQIVSATASSKESIAVVLTSGITVSLGAPDDIALKEETVLGILSKYSGQVSYINVRVPSKPTYRAVSEDAAASDGSTSTADSLPYQDQTTTDDSSTGDQASTDESQESSSEDTTTSTDSSDVPSDAAYNGGYYLDDGTWVNYFWDTDGNLVHGYYDSDDNWVDLG